MTINATFYKWIDDRLLASSDKMYIIDMKSGRKLY